jgi:hypothetical protein
MRLNYRIIRAQPKGTFLNQSPDDIPGTLDRWQLSGRVAGLWWLDLDDVPANAWRRWAAILDEEERARAVRFVHERDRHQFIAAHALLRVLLQHVDGRPAGAWRFTSGIHGKPALHADHGLARLNFNISHTHGAVACGMSLDHAIGVDISGVRSSSQKPISPPMNGPFCAAPRPPTNAPCSFGFGRSRRPTSRRAATGSRCRSTGSPSRCRHRVSLSRPASATTRRLGSLRQ